MPHAHFHYAHNMYKKFEKSPLKTAAEIDYKTFIPNSTKKLPKMTKFRRL